MKQKVVPSIIGGSEDVNEVRLGAIVSLISSIWTCIRLQEVMDMYSMVIIV